MKQPIYVAGHNGLVGSAVMRNINSKGIDRLDLLGFNRDRFDLTNQKSVIDLFFSKKPQSVFLCAAKVGGIHANSTYSGSFIYENLMIQNNMIECCLEVNAKLLFLGSSCIYPRDCPQPIKEEYLLTGPLEKTNEPYAVAKIAGIKLGQAYHRQYGLNFIAAMPCNVYGPGDKFNKQDSHVIPALMFKFHEAKMKNAESVEVWGSGKPLREFIYVDDLAEALVLMMETHNDPEIVNVGSSEEISIRDLANLMAKIVGFNGKIVFNETQPDGTPRKIMDSSKIRSMGWKPKMPLERGLRYTYQWFLSNVAG